MTETKKLFHEQVAEKLIEQLKQGTAPWQKPWKSSDAGSPMPRNPITGKRYKGINAIQLMSRERIDPRWMTYKQAIAQGARVRKGEKGTLIQYWKFTDKQVKKDINGVPLLDQNGKFIHHEIKLERPRLFFATVFNAEQIDGLPQTTPEQKTWSDIERAESILASSGAVIQHGEINRAFYRSSTDTIHLPKQSEFLSAENYYATALHELGHWTGHASRLNRDIAHPFGSEGYAKEELRAEIASMILGDELGIGYDPGQHLAYVASWIKVLQNDPLELLRAASDAEKIQAYALALEQKQIQEIESHLSQTTHEESQMQSQYHGTVISPDSTSEEILADQLESKLADQVDQLSREVFQESIVQQAQLDNLLSINVQTNVLEKIYINVPYAEKDQAKTLGARWDKQEQSWYVPVGIDFSNFEKWSHRNTGTEEHHTKEIRTEEATDSRRYLIVPYEERQAAKNAGALWDRHAKSWYVDTHVDINKLRSWLPENITSQQDPAITPREEFSNFLRSLGCDVTGEHPVMDGKKHRISVEGDRKGERAGFYVAYMDGQPAGYIKNNRTGAEKRWKAKGYVLDQGMKLKLQADALKKLQMRVAEQERVYKQSAQRISKQIENLVQVITPTPYMIAKGIEPQSGVFTDKDGETTYIPAIDSDGKQWTMQYIQADGTKRFAKDCKKEGCFHVIGGLDALKQTTTLFIAEGYATAASLSKALGCAVIAAFDCGNLKPVAMALHEKFPNKFIVIAGDDDRHLEKTQGINPGKVKAQEAAQAVSGKAVFPIFAPGEQDSNQKGFTDFNDLASKSVLGIDGVERQMLAVINSIAGNNVQVAEQKQVLQAKSTGRRQLVNC